MRCVFKAAPTEWPSGSDVNVHNRVCASQCIPLLIRVTMQGKTSPLSTSSFAIEHPPGNGQAGPSGNGPSGAAQTQSSRVDSGD